MLKNANLLAKIGADTAENELNFAAILPIGRCKPRPRRSGSRCRSPGPRGSGRSRATRLSGAPSAGAAPQGRRACVRGLGLANLANFAKFCKFLAGSFSAVSKRNFARKYAFDSFKLYKICILLHRCNLKIFAKNRFEKSAIFRENSAKFCKCCKICKIWPYFKNCS